MTEENRTYITHLKVTDVPWHRLTTAYGRGTDFPAHLTVLEQMRDLASVKESLYELTTNMEHQSNLIRFKSTDCWMESQDLHCKSSTSRCQYDPEQSAKCSTAPDSVMGLRSASALRHRRELHPHLRTQLPPVFSLTAYSVFA